MLVVAQGCAIRVKLLDKNGGARTSGQVKKIDRHGGKEVTDDAPLRHKL